MVCGTFWEENDWYHISLDIKYNLMMLRLNMLHLIMLKWYRKYHWIVFLINVNDIFKVPIEMNSLCLKTYDCTPKLWQQHNYKWAILCKESIYIFKCSTEILLKNWSHGKLRIILKIGFIHHILWICKRFCSFVFCCGNTVHYSDSIWYV